MFLRPAGANVSIIETFKVCTGYGAYNPITLEAAKTGLTILIILF